jgi:hypothetical protein
MGERSEAVRARVEQARENQRQRFASTSLRCNADMGPTEVDVAGNARGVPVGRGRARAGEGGDAGWCLNAGTSLAPDERAGVSSHIEDWRKIQS